LNQSNPKGAFWTKSQGAAQFWVFINKFWVFIYKFWVFINRFEVFINKFWVFINKFCENVPGGLYVITPYPLVNKNAIKNACGLSHVNLWLQPTSQNKFDL
jgi:hypothetical protein